MVCGGRGGGEGGRVGRGGRLSLGWVIETNCAEAFQPARICIWADGIHFANMLTKSFASRVIDINTISHLSPRSLLGLPH